MDKKSIFLALFIFIIIAFPIYFTLIDTPVFVLQPPPAAEDRADEELEDVNFNIFNDAQNHELKLKSQYLENYHSDQKMLLWPVEVEVYSLENGELLYTLTADSAFYYSTEDYLELRDNVIIDSEEYQIEAEEVDYFLNRNFIEGRDSVSIIGRDFDSSGYKFTSDLNLRNLSLSANEESNRASINFNRLLEE